MTDAACNRRQIFRIFEEELHIPVPAPDTDLIETGALDSLAFVSLLVHLEERFGVRIALSDLDLDRFRSIARIADFLAASAADTAAEATSA